MRTFAKWSAWRFRWEIRDLMQGSFISFIHIVFILLKPCFFAFLQIFLLTLTILRSFTDKQTGDISVFLTSSLLSCNASIHFFLLSISSYYGGLFYIKSFPTILIFDGMKNSFLKSLSLHWCFVYRKFYENFISKN